MLKRLIAATLALLCVQVSAARAQGEGYLEIVVTDGAGVLAENPDAVVYMPCGGNQWTPNGWPSGPATKQPAGGEPGAWTIRIPLMAVPAPGLDYKITLGSWERVELNADGSERENRHVERKTGVERITVEAFADKPPPVPTVTGRLDVFTMTSPVQRVVRTVRVWLPPGYDTDRQRRYPVLYMNDGQNLFDELTSFAGEWGADETVTGLIESGAIEPMIVVGVDNMGRMRSTEYLPFDAGSAAPQALGGHADKYAEFLVKWLKPRIDGEYRTLPDAAHTGLGGSSFGGVVTLYTAMEHPGVYGRLLVESPSLWVGDGKLMEMIRGFDGAWPGRVFVGMGGSETGGADRDAELVALAEELETALEEAPGAPGAVELVIEPGAAHNEEAWRGRLGGALTFLFGAGEASGE